MIEIYKDPKYSSEERTKGLLSRMTIEEKIGQMYQADGRKHKQPEVSVKEKYAGYFFMLWVMML